MHVVQSLQRLEQYAFYLILRESMLSRTLYHLINISLHVLEYQV